MIRAVSVGGVLIVLAGLGLWYWLSEPRSLELDQQTGKEAASSEGSEVAEVQRLKLLGSRLEAVQQPLCKPEPGDWLTEHEEDGQTFSQFLMTRPMPVSKELTTFYLQPIGAFTKTQRRLLNETARGLQLFYGRKVVFLPDISRLAIPARARRINDATRQPQILTTYVMHEILIPQRPADAIAVLALSAEDLWPGMGWNFVFGQASLVERVGVWSIARYGDPDESDAAYLLCLERMLGTAFHESGHMLGMRHCKAWNCCLNGSNNLEESDRHPLWFCAECQPKAWWACGLQPERHLTEMLQFAEQSKLKPAAQHWHAAGQLIRNP